MNMDLTGKITFDEATNKAIFELEDEDIAEFEKTLGVEYSSPMFQPLFEEFVNKAIEFMLSKVDKNV
jgi:hypothetical protein